MHVALNFVFSVVNMALAYAFLQSGHRRMALWSAFASGFCASGAMALWAFGY